MQARFGSKWSSLESTGIVLRGTFEAQPRPGQLPDIDVEWCERRILQSIHRRTLSTLRENRLSR